MATNRPRILMVGGDDVHQRLDLMDCLSAEFELLAAGSSRALEPRFTGAGFPYRYYPMVRGPDPLRDAFTFYSLLRLIRELRPDVVHAFATKPCVWGRLAASRAGVPVIVGTLPGLGSLFSRNDLPTRAIRALYARLQRAASLRSDLTIVQNEADARELKQRGIVPQERLAIVSGSGVRTDVLDPRKVSEAERRRARQELGDGAEAVVVTMISRVIRTKGVLDFAEASDTLAGHRANVRFVLVGPDDQESIDRLTPSELERLRRSVIWLGWRDDVRGILAGTDIFVLPTYYPEGVPRVLLEAASMGLPLVTTESPGCNAVVVDRHNGYRIPRKDARALAEAIERLVADTQLRRDFSRASREIATSRFDVEVIAQRTAKHYRELLNRRRGS